MGNPIQDLRTEVKNKPTTLDMVSSLLDKENIEMKTEIINPYALGTLMTIAYYLKQHKDDISYNILNKWKNLLLEYMVSHKRKSREEITEILKGYFTLEREKEKQLSLTSNLAKMNEHNSF